MPSKCLCDEKGAVIKNNAYSSYVISITEAIEQYHNHQSRKKSFNIQCVVLSTHLHETAKSVSNRDTKLAKPNFYVSLLVADLSLPLNTCAKVQLYTHYSNGVDFGPGDVLLFNNVFISQLHCIGSNIVDYELNLDPQDQQPGIVCEFTATSWESTDPEPQVIKYKRDLKNIPEKFFTKSFVENALQLESWYKDTFSGEFLLQSTSLPLSKCRRRRLRDIKTANLLSDVIVQIHALEIKDVNFARKNKRRRVTEDVRSTCAFVVVSDGTCESDIMTLRNSDRIISNLKAAQLDSSFVLITRLMSKIENNAVILELTSESQIYPFEGLPQMINRSTQLSCTNNQFSCTSMNSEKLGLKTLSEIEITSRLIDIYFPTFNLSISANKTRSSLDVFLDALIFENNDGKLCYRNAMLSIQRDDTILQISATNDIIQKLCLDFTPAQVSSSNRNEVMPSENEQDLSIGELVSNLLFGLIDEDIILNWRIHHNELSNEWICMDVGLPVFHY